MLKSFLLALALLTVREMRAAEDQWRIVPFSSADGVRVEITAPASAVGLQLTGSIQSEGGKAAFLWQGPLGIVSNDGKLTTKIEHLHPGLWSPARPNLYELVVGSPGKNNEPVERKVRFGFRSFESREGHFLLNGKPIFLRGLAINPPGRTVPAATGETSEFARAYVKFLRSQNFNMIRMTHDSQAWFDACDELGMMVYQGQYGSPLESDPGKKRPPVDLNASVEAYKELFRTYARHPSILIYVLSNELPTSGNRGKAFHEFLLKAHQQLQAWDNTRLYIGNAGYGEGREGDVCDVHRYWGWYYNSFLTYYNLRDPFLYNHLGEGWTEAPYDEDAGDVAAKKAASQPRTISRAQSVPKTQLQPLTFSECVGNFTGPLGEYNIIMRKQLGAQLNWTGHSATQREDALEYQSFMAQQAAESFRRMRPLNPRLSGLMPFTILFYNWSGITNFDQMKPKPAAFALGTAYQPVLLSWELWTPQVYSGTTIRPIAHIVNDSEDTGDLKKGRLAYQLEDPQRKTVLRGETDLPDVVYFGTHRQLLKISLPPELPSGAYHLSGKILSGTKEVSRNTMDIFIAGTDWRAKTEWPGDGLSLYDPVGKTSAALKKLGIRFSPLKSLEPLPNLPMTLIIGEDSGENIINPAPLRDFLLKGGRVVCLRQDPERARLDWLPEKLTFFRQSPNALTYPPAARPFAANLHINPERPGHPVFYGLERRHFYSWSDYTGWDQTKGGFPAIYPVTSGYKLERAGSLAHVAILADYDRGLEGVALCEMFHGKGTVLVCAFDLVARIGLDPIADRLLQNILRYAQSPDGHKIHPEIVHPVEWGNYASECGLINGPQYGLVVNADWVPPETNPSARPLTQEQGAWNTRPGDQFVPHGRRLLGPYCYSTGSSLKDLQPASPTASGFFWAQIPFGKTQVITQASNPAKTNCVLSMSIDDQPGMGDDFDPRRTNQRAHREITGRGDQRLRSLFRLESSGIAENNFSMNLPRFSQAAGAGSLFFILISSGLRGAVLEELRVGIAAHAFDHLSDVGEQAEAAAASGANILYVSGVGVLGYNGLPEETQFQKQKAAAARYLKHAHSQGTRLAIGYVCATSIVDLEKFDQHWTPSFRKRFQTPPGEWRQQDREGHPLPSWYGGLYQPACMCNPDWKAYEHFIVKQQLEAGCDGIFFDNPTVHPQGCYCRFCMEKYVLFLGSESPARKVDSNFLPALRKHAVDHPARFMEFRCTVARDFLADMRRYARTINRHALMTANNSLNSADALFSQSRIYGYNIFEMSRAEDLVVLEDMSSQPRILAAGNTVEYGGTYEQVIAISHGKPVVAVCLADADYHTPSDLVRLAMGEAAAHGCSHLWWPTWPAGERQRMSEAIRPEADFLREHSSLLNEGAPRCDVLMLLPVTGYLRTAECKSSQDAAQLTAANISYQVQTLEELNRSAGRSQKPRLILTPAGFSLNRAQLQAMNHQFGSGPKIVSTGETNWMTQVREFAPPISVNGDGAKFVRATIRDRKKRTCLELLNLNILKTSSLTDRVSPARNLELEFEVPFQGISKINALSADPDGTQGALSFSQKPMGKNSRVTIQLPRLQIHTIVTIE